MFLFFVLLYSATNFVTVDCTPKIKIPSIPPLTERKIVSTINPYTSSPNEESRIGTSSNARVAVKKLLKKTAAVLLKFFVDHSKFILRSLNEIKKWSPNLDFNQDDVGM